MSIVSISTILYEMVYQTEKEYYDSLLTNLQESQSLSSQVMKAIDILLFNNEKFDAYTTKVNKMMPYQARTIARYLDKCRLDKHSEASKIFPYKSYYISEDIHLLLPSLPLEMDKSLDKISQVKLALYDKKLYNRMNTKLYFIGQLPLWFTKYTTVEKMSEYLFDNTPGFIYEGFYKVEELVPLIKKFSVWAYNYYKDINQKIKKEKLHLDYLMKDIQLAEERAIKDAHTMEDKKKTKDLFKQYKSNVELIYLQLGVYMRSVMRIYGKALTEMSSVIQTVFEDIDDPKLKSMQFANDIDLIKDLE